MIRTGKITNIVDAGGRIALTVSSEGATIDDLTLARLSRDEYQVVVGDAVILLEISGPDGEFLALPVVQAVTLAARLVLGSPVILGNVAANASPIALLSDVATLRSELHLHEHSYIAPTTPAGPASTTGGPTLSNPVGTQETLAE